MSETPIKHLKITKHTILISEAKINHKEVLQAVRYI